MVSRRGVLAGLVAPALLRWQAALANKGEFERLLLAVESDSTKFPGARGRIEGKAFETSSFGAAQPKVGKSNRTVSLSAIRMITAFEVSGEKVYEARYRKPIWPKGASGVTFAIGYDLGYVNEKEFGEDWENYIKTNERSTLSQALGIKGAAAGKILPAVQSIELPFAVAQRQFIEQTLKKYISLTEFSLQNTNNLSDTAMGALVSLTFNRGASYRVRADEDPSGRYREMRKIRALMAENKFHDIPAQIRSMKRIWIGNKDMSGLLTRRDMEADLFEAEL